MKPVVLIILDGFGIAAPSASNAISQANTPHLDAWIAKYPHTQLRASGQDVGLPEGNQGTSEAGHITIGAGRVVYQPSIAIDRAIRDGSFAQNQVLKLAIDQSRGHTLHLMGLCSDAGVHAHLNHMYALMQLAKQGGLSDVALHLFLDGRDVPEKSALHYIEQVEAKIAEIGIGYVASVMGRYYSMDRDTNWDRTEKAYEVLTQGSGHRAQTAQVAIEAAYIRGDRSDYYIEPTVIEREGKPRATVESDDVVIFFNFRSDRARQITYAFTEEHFEGFTRPVTPKVHFVGMSTYDKHIVMPAAFPQLDVENNLAQILSTHGIKQFRTAETEKYAHVTFFFNSQVEEPVAGEDRALVHSPKVPSYDAQPEMSAAGVTQALLSALEKNEYGFIAVNYANPDLVGHSANLAATIMAVEVIDQALGTVWEAVQAQSGILLITGDHGNAESMIDNGIPNPSHTMNPVPFITVGNQAALRDGGGLRDIAPTILELMQIAQPTEMTGKSLLKH